jgi:hypothetical protein
MFPVRSPSTPPQNPLSLSGSDRTASPTQVRPSSQPVAVPLPPSVTVGDLIFTTGRVMTALSDAEERVLCGALHSQTQKEPLGSLKDNLLTYAIGAKDYFSPMHLPRDLPERMLVTCVLDPSLNLERVIIADLNQQVYCDARFEPYATAAQALRERGSLPITAEAASRPGATVQPAFSPPAPPEAASPYAALTARAQFSAAARGGSLAAAPFSGAPEARATKRRREGASNAQIRAQLKHPDGTLRTGQQVMDALHARGLGADRKRITSLLQAAVGVRQRPSASDAQLSAQLRNPDGTVRTGSEVTSALNASGLGGNHNRIEPLLRAAKEMQQPAATGSQAGGRMN